MKFFRKMYIFPAFFGIFAGNIGYFMGSFTIRVDYEAKIFYNYRSFI